MFTYGLKDDNPLSMVLRKPVEQYVQDITVSLKYKKKGILEMYHMYG